MKLQVALDTLSEEECIDLLDEIKDYVGVIEVGTPFVIESGMQPVRHFKQRYPDLAVLADCKIMDAGSYEADKCFDAGADIVTVLGVSNDATIKGVVASAKKHNKKVMVDMIEVKNLAQRTAELDKMGADYICVHTAFDIQESGANPLSDLQVVNKIVTNAKSAVAGGVKLATIDDIVAEGAEIIVVGGAICTADNRAEMAKLLKGRLK